MRYIQLAEGRVSKKTEGNELETGRRTFLKKTVAGATSLAVGPSLALVSEDAFAKRFDMASVDEQAVAQARKVANGRKVALTILEPSGSLGNIKPVATRWTAQTGIEVKYIEVPLEQINQKVMLEAVAKTGSFDLALPASFGIPDLVGAGAILNLDRLASKYQPANYLAGYLYKVANLYKGSLYGYETDGDAYVMFYLRDWLENPEEDKKFFDKHGYHLKVPETWEQLDAMMAFFNRPSENKYGGALFRTRFFVPWEYWIRFQAKGFYPFDDNMKPQINNDAGVKALEEFVAASKSLYPGSRTNGLFENFEAFGKGNKFCDIGWGGTQKFLNTKSSVRGKLAFGPMPGGVVNGKLLVTPYFNWGWNYVVSAFSREQELAYLYSLFACSPKMSTIAIEDPNGYFDPFRKVHYKNPEIIKLYTEPFLKVQEFTMANCIPDLYLRGHGEYFDALGVNLQAADTGQKKPKEALDDVARKWEEITERMGRESQIVQWRFLRQNYPASIRDRLK